MSESTKSILLLLLGLILGYLIGHYALPPECKPDDGSRGVLGVPPSQLPQVIEIPEGSWPKYDCEGAQAIQQLDDLFALLEQAATMEPPRIDEVMQIQVVNAIYENASWPDDPTKGAERCKGVKKALQDAQAIVEESNPGPYNWTAVIDDLQMGH